ncbi:MAG TPA: HAMP domain-containing sensor histidine kinase [Candidatus Baltobacteraceae bacterium]|nr:HAMP domain-containing sensor histidine kinase [Candidatus Baltobacteraceae bacterium]
MNRVRLSGVYVLIMLAGLLIFAAAAVVAIDRTQRSALDARLHTWAKATAQFVDVAHGRISLDRSDREQIAGVIGAEGNAAIVGANGAVTYATTSRPLAQLRTPRGLPAGFFDFGGGDAKLRAFALPVVRGGVQSGTIVVWAGSDWIDETDRNLAIALAAGAFLIAALALVAGNVVTKRALEDAFARQRRFTADASHELRAPLAVIRAESDLALRKDRAALEYRSAMQTIASEADRMEAIIGDLLSAARAESRALVEQRIDVSELLREVAERLAPAAAVKDARVRVHGVERAVIFADAHALERALLAVGHNAVQHAPPGSAVELRGRRTDRGVEISVEDRGAGFSHEALEHALERFWREPGAAPGTGSGLGLAIARSIVEAFRGHISLSNASEGGAIVRMRFPAA